MNRTDRLYALVEELRAVAPHVRSARWLAERFEVSVRTVERDLSALQQSGVPIWTAPGRRGGYGIDPTMTLPPLNFSPAEATAIAVALATSGPLPFGDAARAALRKVVAAMSSADRQGARDLVGRIHLLPSAGDGLAPPEDRGGPSQVVRAVEAAVAERRVLELDYVDKAGERTDGRLVEAFGLAGGDRGWYLMGWCRLRGGGRAFRLDRIRGARVTDEAAPERRLEEVAAGIAGVVRRPQIDG